MPNYEWSCEQCGNHWEAVVRYEDRDSPQACSECGSVGARHFPSPTVLKASYPDGHRRKGWADMKEIARLKVEAAGARKEAKKDIVSEIRKLGGKVTE